MGRRGAPGVSSYTNLLLSAKKQLAPPHFVFYQVADANHEYGKVRQPSILGLDCQVCVLANPSAGRFCSLWEPYICHQQHCSEVEGKARDCQVFAFSSWSLFAPSFFCVGKTSAFLCHLCRFFTLTCSSKTWNFGAMPESRYSLCTRL